MDITNVPIEDRHYALEQLNGEPWAILPSHLEFMTRLLADGVDLGAVETIEAKRPIRRLRNPGAIAVMPVHGIIQKRGGILMDFFGGTSTEALGRAIDAAMAEPKISAIVLDIDSPGGSVYGVEELATKIRTAKGKPIVAVANDLMASAAYYIGAQADEVIATPSSELGSIGVIAQHQDVSALLKRLGVNITLITAGKYKAEGNPYEPLDEEAESEIQKRVDRYYDQFVRAVAAGRSTSMAKVKADMGQGRVFGAVEAVERNMADRIATLDEVLAGLGGSETVGGARAEDEIVPLTADGSDGTETISGGENIQITIEDHPEEPEEEGQSGGLSTEDRRRRLRLAERG
jgi:signal peptide peptidase SppA